MALTRISSFITANTGVTSGSYGGTNTIPVFAVNTEGQVTYAANVTPSIANTQITGLITSSQIATVANTQVTGLLTSSQIATVANTQVTGLITTGQIATVANTQITGTITSTQLSSTGVTAGTYGGSTNIPVIIVNAAGQLTSAANATITIPPSTAIFANSGQLTANSSTGNVLLGLATTGTAATYGNTTYYPVITTDAYGRVTTVTNTVVGLITTASYQIGSFGVGTAASGTAGEIRATNNITAYYSDDRLKTKLGNIINALDKVKTLSGFYYEANEIAQALGYEPIREVGVSAQQVQAVLPEVVVPAPIDNKYLTVRYEKLIPLLIEAIKELSEEVERLRK